MVLPNSIHDAPPRQTVVRGGEPTCQRRATIRFRVARRQNKATRQAVKHPQRTRSYFPTGSSHITAIEQIDRPGLASGGSRAGEAAGSLMNGAGVNQVRRGKRFQLRLDIGQFAADFCSRRCSASFSCACHKPSRRSRSDARSCCATMRGMFPSTRLARPHRGGDSIASNAVTTVPCARFSPDASTACSSASARM